jgi:hypothetical protein
MERCLTIIDDIKSSGSTNLEKAILISAQLIMKQSLLTTGKEDRMKLNNAVDLICKLREKEKEREMAALSELEAEATAAASSGFAGERANFASLLGKRGGKSRRMRKKRHRNSKKRTKKYYY